jgi:hypothetical protein
VFAFVAGLYEDACHGNTPGYSVEKNVGIGIPYGNTVDVRINGIYILATLTPGLIGFVHVQRTAVTAAAPPGTAASDVYQSLPPEPATPH